VSSTLKRSRPSACSTTLASRPPDSVNLTALPAKLSRIWRIRPSSARIRPSPAGVLQPTSSPFSPARGASSSQTERTMSSTSTAAGCSSILLAPSLAKSSGVVALLGAQLRGLQQPRHAEHAVERRAELVAERGELVGGDVGARRASLGKRAGRSTHDA
jgi:hypothetical protein